METTELDQLPLHVFYSEEDGEYVATVPGMPLISALAETEAEAISELQIVLKTCAEITQENPHISLISPFSHPANPTSMPRA